MKKAYLILSLKEIVAVRYEFHSSELSPGIMFLFKARTSRLPLCGQEPRNSANTTTVAIRSRFLIVRISVLFYSKPIGSVLLSDERL